MKKKVIIGVSVLAFVLIISFITRLCMLHPQVSMNKDTICIYNKISKSIKCTQISDVVPDWFHIDNDGLWGLGSNITMNLIFKKSDAEYYALKMTDSVLIPGLNRRFIYEKENQTLSDFVKFKRFIAKNNSHNYGSTVLWCSENRLYDDSCKTMKKSYNR